MAISKFVVASLLLSLLVLDHLAKADHMVNPAGGPNGPPTIDCGSSCTYRCQLSKRRNLCMRACGTCCARCSCVPPGTSGNYDTCPCYANMTTRGGVRKCP